MRITSSEPVSFEGLLWKASENFRKPASRIEGGIGYDRRILIRW